MLIRDIPKIKETVEGVKQIKSFKAVFPLLKPFLRLLGVDTSSVEASLAQIKDLESQVNEMSSIPDRFNDLFASRGWILYELLDLEIAKNAIEKAEAGDFKPLRKSC